MADAPAAPVTAPLSALLDQLGAAMAGTGRAPTPAALYATLVRIRDEAALVEARASDRDATVRRLLADLAAMADRLDRLDGIALPAVTTLAALAARRAAEPPHRETTR